MPENSSQPLIIAHRGASAIAPENTAAAFRQAIADGADGVEFDVRLTKNKVPVVFHDPTLKRICSQNYRVANVTAEFLKTADAGSWFNQRFPERSNADFAKETVWSLAETLPLLKNAGAIYIELKCTARDFSALCEQTAQVIRESKMLPQIVVKSFHLEAIGEIKKHLPEIRTAALFAPKILSIFRNKNRMIDEALRFEANELSLHYSLASEKLVVKAAASNLQTIVWTADHPVWIERAREIGLKAIITNDPARMLAKRSEVSK